jgi:hypothetical protein
VDTNVDVPSGFANPCVYSLRAASTSTLEPQARAVANAETASGLSAAQATFAGEAAARPISMTADAPGTAINAVAAAALVALSGTARSRR